MGLPATPVYGPAPRVPPAHDHYAVRTESRPRGRAERRPEPDLDARARAGRGPRGAAAHRAGDPAADGSLLGSHRSNDHDPVSVEQGEQAERHLAVEFRAAGYTTEHHREGEARGPTRQIHPMPVSSASLGVRAVHPVPATADVRTVVY